MRIVLLTLRSLRHRQILPITTGFLIVSGAWLGLAQLKRASAAPDMRLSVATINEVMMFAIYVLPIVAAIIASRVVTTGTVGGMDQKLHSIGISPLRQFRAHLVVTALHTLVVGLFVIVLAFTLTQVYDFSSPANYPQIVVGALLAIVASSIAVSAVHTWAATVVSQQGVTLGLAVVAAMATSALPFSGFNQFSWALPWGLTSAANPVSASNGVITLSEQPLVAGVVAVMMAVVWCGIVIFVTRLRKVEK